jgi:protein-disulfide isomerase
MSAIDEPANCRYTSTHSCQITPEGEKAEDMAKKSASIGKQSTPSSGKSTSTTSSAATKSSGLSRNAIILIVVGVIAAFGLVLVVQQLSLASSTSTATASAPAGDTGSVAGPADAKVVVMDFSDFQCPHCKTWAESVEPQLRAEYVDTGKVQLDYKHFLVISKESEYAANAAECAAEQGLFWPYHDLLFAQQGLQGRDTVSPSNLKRLGTQIGGLDTAQFNACVDSNKYQELIYRDVQEGNDLGVTGTPSIFVNGTKVDASQDYNAVKAAIEAALASGQ